MSKTVFPSSFPYIPYYYYPSIEEKVTGQLFQKKVDDWLENAAVIIKEKGMLIAAVCLKEWETGHFGINCAMIEFLWTSEKEKYHYYLDEILREAKNVDIKHLSIRINVLEQQLQFELEKSGFIQMDAIVHFNAKLSDVKLQNDIKKSEFFVREGSITDKVRLCEIAASSYRYDRFHSDSYLSTNKVDLAYADWMSNSLNGLADKVYVLADISETPQGFATINFETLGGYKIAKIWLFGISEETQGTKAGYVFFNAIIERLREEGVYYLEVGTQIKNVRAMRFYAKYQLLPIDPVYAYRKIID